MTIERRGLARGLKIWIDILFFVSVTIGGLVAVLWPIAGYFDGSKFELSIPVSIGETSLLPVHRLEVSSEALRQDMTGDHLFNLVNARGQLRFSASRLGPSFAFWLIIVLLVGAWTYGLQLLRRILGTTADGRPFDPSNIRRLNLLGWMILGTGSVIPFFQYYFARWVLSRVPLTGTPVRASLQVREEWIICGLLVLVLAAIWKEAVRIAEDQSLTV